MSSPVPIFGTQNLKDDDSQVIDSLLIETDAPPDLRDAVEPIVIPAKPVIPVPTRMMTGTEILTATTTPYQLVPADPNRVKLHVDVYSWAVTPGTKDYALIADNSGGVSNPTTTQGSMRIRHGKSFDLDEHTGALWVTPGPILTDNIEITWRAVTK